MYTTNTQLLKHDVKIDSLSFNLSSVETITFRETKSILLLMMTWALASSGHEYLWYWQYSIHMHSYSIREHFITFACAVYVLRIDRKWWFAFYVFSNILEILHTCLLGQSTPVFHYSDDIMGTMASQITSLMIVYLTVYTGADPRKHLSSASLAFVRGIHR